MKIYSIPTSHLMSWEMEPHPSAYRCRTRRCSSLTRTLLHYDDLLGRVKDGFLYFVARKDDLIKTKGERVSPKEIENTLCEMDGVVEAAVIGVPDEIFGQAIKAFIVKDNENKLTEKTVMKYCTLNLEPFMIPKYVEFRESFPKSPSGKVDKKQLK